MQRPFCVEKVGLSFVQPLSLASLDSSPSRGASGETVHFAGTAKASPTRRGGTPSGVTERLYKGKPAHNQKSPRHPAEGAGGLAIWRWRGHAESPAAGDG